MFKSNRLCQEYRLIFDLILLLMISILLEEQHNNPGILQKASKHNNVFEKRNVRLYIKRSNPYKQIILILRLAASSILYLYSLFEVKDSEYYLKEHLNQHKSLPGNKLPERILQYQILLLPDYTAHPYNYRNLVTTTNNLERTKVQWGKVLTKSYFPEQLDLKKFFMKNTRILDCTVEFSLFKLGGPVLWNPKSIQTVKKIFLPIKRNLIIGDSFWFWDSWVCLGKNREPFQNEIEVFFWDKCITFLLDVNKQINMDK